jgi:hypothetical protein
MEPKAQLERQVFKERQAHKAPLEKQARRAQLELKGQTERRG